MIRIGKCSCTNSIESVLTFHLSAWFGYLNCKCKSKLNKVVTIVSKIVGKPLKYVIHFYADRTGMEAKRSISDSSHHLFSRFEPLKSGRHKSPPSLLSIKPSDRVYLVLWIFSMNRFLLTCFMDFCRVFNVAWYVGLYILVTTMVNTKILFYSNTCGCHTVFANWTGLCLFPLQWINSSTLVLVDSHEKLQVVDRSSQEVLETLDLEQVQLVYNSRHFKSLATGGNVSQALVREKVVGSTLTSHHSRKLDQTWGFV